MRARRLLLAALAVVPLMALIDAAPASAALPPVACRTYSGPYFCVGFDGYYVSAAASNPGPARQCFNFECREVRIELVYFPGNPALTGETVLSRTAPVVNFAGGPVIKAPPVATWKPGTYCVREYNRATGQWYDNICLSTSAGLVQGFYGTTTPGL